ncbi:acyltransferase [Pseudoalteromonas sp. B129b]
MYLSIQYLRALAALMVLLTHTSFKLENNGSDLLSWFNIGGYGVDLFFIISGFIMCLTVQDKKINFTTFMKQRVIRIIPLYWLMTSVALIIFFINPSLVNSSGGVTSIISSYLLIPDGTKYLVNNGWTLSYEFFSTLFFLFFYLIKESKNYLRQ